MEGFSHLPVSALSDKTFRERRNFPLIRQEWANSQPGGKSYKYTLMMRGSKEAEAQRVKADEMLARRAKAAHVTLEGTPLPAPYPYQVTKHQK